MIVYHVFIVEGNATSGCKQYPDSYIMNLIMVKNGFFYESVTDGHACT